MSRSPCAAPVRRSPATRSARASSSTPSATSTGSSRIDPEARTAVVAARRRARRPAACGRAARAAVRPRPVHPHPLHDRRDDRQQRLRLAGAGLRPDRRQRGRAAAWRSAPATTAGDVRRPADAGWSTAHLAHVRTDVRPVHAARSAATRSSTCCRRTAAASTASSSAPRARSASSSRPPCGWSRTSRRQLVVLGYPSMAEAADAVPDAAGERRSGWSRARVSTPGSSTWCARRVAPCRELPRGAGWLFVEVAGEPGRWPPVSPRPERSSTARSTTRPRPPRSGGSARTAPGSPRAAWTDRRTPAGRTPPSRPSGSAPGSASSTSCCASTACDGVPYGHFGDGCVHVRIDFPFDRRRAAPVPRVPDRAARRAARRTAARCPGSTATAGPAPSCCR